MFLWIRYKFKGDNVSQIFKMEELDGEKINKIQAYIDDVEDKQGDVIKILHFAQECYGYLPKELQLYIARAVDLPASKINGIVTFYSFFNEKPVGKYAISVCKGTACFIHGSQDILDEFEKVLNIGPSGLSKNGLFSLSAVRCVGACGLGPVVKINDKIIGHFKKEMVKDLIKDLTQKERGVKN